ncbi:DNA polymerase III subunit delta [Sphingomonas sp. KR1UV-12]|uniref:DNA-directed DNA polymerase n=1 Tax=Sphingomonas aurea TaxID=3063994 RepID=A0ABT9ELY9_9SPHN|nr:DNA polymerase III subunit delta [Sphingomonas sp. KR1UV-12]MDP1027808.1 DNA polymerase III subunit delta [Sphingomonas sp. KR1UV-12]
MKASANQIRQALSAPRPTVRLYLLHGPDEAGAGALAALLGTAMGATAERIDLDGATLRGDPARLADEASSLSLFGDPRWIRVTQTGEESLNALAALLEADGAANPVVALAPTVRTTAKIVKLATDSPHAMAFGCYAPTAQDAERLAATLAGEQGLRLAPGTAARLVAASGGDRAVMAREIDKLALYLDAAPDRPHDLDHDAIDAVGADLDEAEATRAVEALVEGRPDQLAEELARLSDAGISPIPWLRQLARRLVALGEMRAEIAAGEAADAVMKRHRVFFRDEPATGRALRRWTPAMLARALDRVRAAERAVMAPANAGTVLAEDAVLSVARALARRG